MGLLSTIKNTASKISTAVKNLVSNSSAGKSSSSAKTTSTAAKSTSSNAAKTTSSSAKTTSSNTAKTTAARSTGASSTAKTANSSNASKSTSTGKSTLSDTQAKNISNASKSSSTQTDTHSTAKKTGTYSYGGTTYTTTPTSSSSSSKGTTSTAKTTGSTSGSSSNTGTKLNDVVYKLTGGSTNPFVIGLNTSNTVWNALNNLAGKTNNTIDDKIVGAISSGYNALTGAVNNPAGTVASIATNPNVSNVIRKAATTVKNVSDFANDVTGGSTNPIIAGINASNYGWNALNNLAGKTENTIDDKIVGTISNIYNKVAGVANAVDGPVNTAATVANIVKTASDNAKAAQAAQASKNTTTAVPSGTDKVTEQEFNRSTAMQALYGTYENYLKGITVGNKNTNTTSRSNPVIYGPTQDVVTNPTITYPEQVTPSPTVGNPTILPTIEDLTNLVTTTTQNQLPSNMNYDYDWGMNEYTDALNAAQGSLDTYTRQLLNQASDNDANSLYNIMRALRKSRASGLTSGASVGAQAANDLQALTGVVGESSALNKELLANALQLKYNLASKQADQPSNVLAMLNAYYTPQTEALSNVLGNYLYNGYGGQANANATNVYNSILSKLNGLG